MCAGRTTFGSLQHSDAKDRDLVAIHGLGGLGGLRHLAVQYTVKLGFKTIVLSRGKELKTQAYEKMMTEKYISGWY